MGQHLGLLICSGVRRWGSCPCCFLRMIFSCPSRTAIDKAPILTAAAEARLAVQDPGISKAGIGALAALGSPAMGKWILCWPQMNSQYWSEVSNIFSLFFTKLQMERLKKFLMTYLVASGKNKMCTSCLKAMPLPIRPPLRPTDIAEELHWMSHQWLFIFEGLEHMLLTRTQKLRWAAA